MGQAAGQHQREHAMVRSVAPFIHWLRSIQQYSFYGPLCSSSWPCLRRTAPPPRAPTLKVAQVAHDAVAAACWREVAQHSPLQLQIGFRVHL